MFADHSLDYIIIGFLVVVIVAFLIGKGPALMRFFEGNRQKPKDAPEYDPARLKKAVLSLCFIFLACELVLLFFDTVPYVALVTVIIEIVTFICICVYFVKRVRIK